MVIIIFIKNELPLTVATRKFRRTTKRIARQHPYVMCTYYVNQNGRKNTETYILYTHKYLYYQRTTAYDLDKVL